MHNVLTVYTKRLRLNKADSPKKLSSQNLTFDKISISNKGKSHVITKKIEENISEKILHLNKQNKETEVQTNKLQGNFKEAFNAAEKKPVEFIFNTIDNSNYKKTNVFPIDDPSSLFK